MATSYSLLKTEIAGFYQRNDLTDWLDTFIDLTESEMQRELKLMVFEDDETLTVTAGEATLPTGFVAARSVTWLATPARVLKYVTPDYFERHAASDPGTVSYYTISGSTMRFTDATDGEARVTYMARFTPLSDSDPSNAILANHPSAYLYGCLEHAAAFCKDYESAANYRAKFDAEMRSIRSDNMAQKYAGATLQVRVA